MGTWKDDDGDDDNVLGSGILWVGWKTDVLIFGDKTSCNIQVFGSIPSGR